MVHWGVKRGPQLNPHLCRQSWLIWAFCPNSIHDLQPITKLENFTSVLPSLFTVCKALCKHAHKLVSMLISIWSGDGAIGISYSFLVGTNTLKLRKFNVYLNNVKNNVKLTLFFLWLIVKLPNVFCTTLTEP